MALPTCACMPGETPSLGDKLDAIYCALYTYGTGGGVVAASLTGNQAWVDAINGDNDNAETGTQALPFLTLAEAGSQAISGDTIMVRPGTFNERNLLKNGVSWNLEAGANVVYTGAVTGGIFDDSVTGSNAAFVGQIVGAGLISQRGVGNSFTVQYAVNITQPNSVVTIIANAIESEPGVTGDQIEIAAINQEDGILRVRCERIAAIGGTNNYAVWWRNGEMNIDALAIESGSVATVYPQVNSTPTGQGYIRAQLIRNTGAGGITIVHSSTDATARFWIEAMQIDCVASGEAILSDAVGKLYVVGTQKILGRCRVTAGDVYIETMKWSANAAGDLITLSGGTVQMQLDSVSDEGVLTGNVIEVSGGTHTIKGMRFTGGATALGINLTGGTLILENCYINTAANASTSPITKSGGTLRMTACVLVANAAADSISAPTAQNVVAMACWANKAVDADVTITTGATGLTVDADVL